jgi:hypothetical protein
MVGTDNCRFAVVEGDLGRYQGVQLIRLVRLSPYPTPAFRSTRR